MIKLFRLILFLISKKNYRQNYKYYKGKKYPNLIFNKIQEGNLEYYSPQENFFFYGNANGSLPCVNKVQVDYLKKKYLLIPQQRTSSIKDGFYSKKVTPNE